MTMLQGFEYSHHRYPFSSVAILLRRTFASSHRFFAHTKDRKLIAFSSVFFSPARVPPPRPRLHRRCYFGVWQILAVSRVDVNERAACLTVSYNLVMNAVTTSPSALLFAWAPRDRSMTVARESGIMYHRCSGRRGDL